MGARRRHHEHTCRPVPPHTTRRRYALRTDGRSFTVAEWALLDDTLNICMDIYADRKMTPGVLDGLRSSLHRQIYGCSDDEREEALDARCAR